MGKLLGIVRPEKKLKDNIYTESSEARNFFEKKPLNRMLGPPNLGVRGKFLVVIHFFQVPYHFSMIFIKIFQNSMIFPGFPGVLSFSQVEWEP